MGIESFIYTLKNKYSINLNEQQQQAVIHLDGPALILAVPGAGKTTTICARVACMIMYHGIDPGKILTVTFSRSAAEDMEERFTVVYGNDIQTKVDFSTIHSFCYKFYRGYLRRNGNSIPILLDSNETKVTANQLLRKIYQEINNEYPSDDQVEVLSSQIGYSVNMMLTDEEINESTSYIDNFPDIFRAYQKYKGENNFIDFDDMLVRTLDIFNNSSNELAACQKQYHYINVDESQDTSRLQHEIIRLLVQPKNNIFMVGDEDQSIYGFRAAFPKALIDFNETYPGAKLYLMEKNYRSTGNIIRAANSFIKINNERYEKNMFTDAEDGQAIQHLVMEDTIEQYQSVAKMVKKIQNYRDAIILFRYNMSAIPLADVFHRMGIPFYMKEHKVRFFEHWVTKDIVNMLKFSLDPTNIAIFEEIYYKMNAYITKDAMLFVKSKWSRGKSPLDILQNNPAATTTRTKSALQRIHKTLNIIRVVQPAKAIDYIENSLEYSNYLKQRTNENGKSTDNTRIILSTLKCIAAKARNIDDFISRLEDLQLIISSSKKNKNSDKNAVVLSTIHGAKGLEFPYVFMVDMVDEYFPSIQSIEREEAGDPRDMEEEVRLCYVGATRAKICLYLTSVRRSNGTTVRPSRFVQKLMNPGQPVERKNDTGLYVGQKVRHIKFGPGRVCSVDGTNEIVSVNFEVHGYKKLSIRMCLKTNLLKILQ